MLNINLICSKNFLLPDVIFEVPIVPSPSKYPNKNDKYKGLEFKFGKSIILLFIGKHPCFFNPAANRLYDVTGFTEKYDINSWVKEI